jgi:hypothetical protein
VVGVPLDGRPEMVGHPALVELAGCPVYCHIRSMHGDPAGESQSKGVHFVIRGSDLVTGAPIDGAVHDGWPIGH